MKVHFDNVDIDSSTGPNTFAHRLARQLFDTGHEVTFEASGADVSLVFIEKTGAPLANKVVQRLDGIWFRPQDFHTKNVMIKDLYTKADCVVWQSRFDSDMTLKWWNAPKKGVVIHNGIKKNPVTKLTIPKLVEMVTTYDRIYVCSSNWHPQKRLKQNVQLFERLRQTHPNSCLIVMGNNPDYRATGTNVFYTGSVSPDVCAQIYSAASWMLHLAWADHCPNVVVEALLQGTPIVCSDVGGTKELVGQYGVVLHDQPYNFELADYDNPPILDTSSIIDLPDRLSLDYGSIANIDIAVVAQQYVSLFTELVHAR